jgi:hypothetical protein
MESEVRKALQGIAGRKAMGVDNLPIELIKAAGELAITALTALCQQIWSSNAWPKEWKRSIFLLLPKKGDLRLCSNHRTIALIPHASKMLLKIIQDRLTTHIERDMELWTWRKMLRTPWTDRRTNASIIDEVKPKRSLEATITQLKLRYFGHVMRTNRTLERDIIIGQVDVSRR